MRINLINGRAISAITMYDIEFEPDHNRFYISTNTQSLDPATIESEKTTLARNIRDAFEEILPGSYNDPTINYDFESKLLKAWIPLKNTDPHLHTDFAMLEHVIIENIKRMHKDTN